MTKKSIKAAGIMKLLKKGYSPREVTQRMAVSYNYAWKLKKLMEAGVETIVAKPTHQYIEIPEEVTRELSGLLNAKPGEFTQADTNVDAILNTRATTYGSFADVARMAQRLKSVAHTAAGEQGKTFAHDQAEALDMIFSKLARILNGDPNYVDSWTDIAGYATLVSDRLQGKTR